VTAASAPPPVRVLTALGEDDAVADVAAHIRRYGELFWDVLLEVAEQVMQRKAREVVDGLYYMPTIRADVFVCSSLADPGTAGGERLHINVLVFQQSLACECEAGADGQPDEMRPIRVSPHKWQSLLPYWLHRITAALNESRPGSAPGIYDAGTRQRLVARIQAKSGGGAEGGRRSSSAGGGGIAGGASALNVQRQAWTPPAVPSNVLTRLA